MICVDCKKEFPAWRAGRKRCLDCAEIRTTHLRKQYNNKTNRRRKAVEDAARELVRAQAESDGDGMKRAIDRLTELLPPK